jgi:hypothetical protein
MRNFLIVSIFLFITATACSQIEKPKIYNPQADAKADIANAVAKAKTEGKHVMLQIGGDW